MSARWFLAALAATIPMLTAPLASHAQSATLLPMTNTPDRATKLGSVSPTGTAIAYTRNRVNGSARADVWVLRLDKPCGQSPVRVRITEDGWSDLPSISRDGAWVAWRKTSGTGQSVWLRDTDLVTAPLQIASIPSSLITDIRLSPNAQWICYLVQPSSGSPTLHVAHVQGSLYELPPMTFAGFALAPAGQVWDQASSYFVCSRKTTSSLQAYTALYRFDTSTGALTQITCPVTGLGLTDTQGTLDWTNFPNRVVFLHTWQNNLISPVQRAIWQVAATGGCVTPTVLASLGTTSVAGLSVTTDARFVTWSGNQQPVPAGAYDVYRLTIASGLVQNMSQQGFASAPGSPWTDSEGEIAYLSHPALTAPNLGVFSAMTLIPPTLATTSQPAPPVPPFDVLAGSYDCTVYELVNNLSSFGDIDCVGTVRHPPGSARTCMIMNRVRTGVGALDVVHGPWVVTLPANLDVTLSTDTTGTCQGHQSVTGTLTVIQPNALMDDAYHGTWNGTLTGSCVPHP